MCPCRSDYPDGHGFEWLQMALDCIFSPGSGALHARYAGSLPARGLRLRSQAHPSAILAYFEGGGRRGWLCCTGLTRRGLRRARLCTNTAESWSTRYFRNGQRSSKHFKRSSCGVFLAPRSAEWVCSTRIFTCRLRGEDTLIHTGGSNIDARERRCLGALFSACKFHGDRCWPDTN
jgi:hypothetical protein